MVVSAVRLVKVIFLLELMTSVKKQYSNEKDTNFFLSSYLLTEEVGLQQVFNRSTGRFIISETKATNTRTKS